MTCPQIVKDLVNKFYQNYSQYKSPEYNETSVRREFIDPFFKSLGWDIDNEAGLDEEFKDVIHEDALRVGESSRAPDYSFRIGGRRIFFVEAKKPYVNLKESSEPAFQVRRYGYSAQLKVSILTDFEEFSVYDVTVKPSLSEKASTRRLLYFTFDQYEEKWDEIAALFSKDAIQHGSIRRYTENLTSGKKQQGTQGLDKDFLTEIEGWREILARNIALRNKDLTQPELNLAVQMTIDRILFLRICEDRGIEPFGQLGKAVENINHYQNLISLFKNADAKYNSGLFHFNDEDGRGTHDTLTLSLVIDDATLKEIINHLYWPTPYVFSEIPSVILGQVYEQFLGKVIRLTPDHHAKVEDKPEVKKAGGVFYTPTYIVDYIVEKTVGALVEGKTPKEVSDIHILDPACGSGSFLIGAYQFLLDWHKRWYTENLAPLLLEGKRSTDREIQDLIPIVNVSTGKGKGKKSGNEHPLPVYKMTDTDWHLTTSEKKRILLNNIYGVDIDTQAVEVTKLSLLLKVLEGESGERIGQKKLVTGRVLPSLDKNIRCGNSLIGGDILLDASLDSDTLKSINPFDWDREFSSVIQNGGFDVVIGNPPYIRVQTLKEYAPIDVDYYKSHYNSASKGNYDIYVVFIEKGLSLLNNNGLLGYILPHKFFNAKYGENIRFTIVKGKHLKQIIHFGHQQVFENATTYTCLLFLGKKGYERFLFEKVDNLDLFINGQNSNNSIFPALDIQSSGEWNFVVGDKGTLINKLKNDYPCFKEFKDKVAQGIRTSANQIYVLDLISEENGLLSVRSKELDKNFIIEKGMTKPFLLGKEIKPYQVLASHQIVIIPYKIQNEKAVLIDESELKNKYPLTFSYLLENRRVLEEREKGRMKTKGWYAYVYPKNIEFMGLMKILVPDIAISSSFAFDEYGDYSFTSGYGITLKSELNISPKFFLGLLNSNLLSFYLKNISTVMRGGYIRFFSQYIEQLPIYPINLSNPTESVYHDQMVSYVTRMLDLYKNLISSRLPQDKDLIQRQIDATNKAINTLVYELYGLTDEEISIVEGGVK